MQLKPVAYYRLGETNTNQALFDSSGYANHGYYQSGVSLNQASVYSRSGGSQQDPDTSASFYTHNSGAKIPASAAQNPKLQFTNKLSASWWEYVPSTAGYGNSGGYYSWVGMGGAISTYITGNENAASDGSLYIGFAGNTSAVVYTNTPIIGSYKNGSGTQSGTLAAGWHHFTVATDLTQSALNQQVRVYIDGIAYPVSIQSGTVPTSYGTNSGGWIGSDGAGDLSMSENSNAFVIDEVAFYNYPLTSQQVNAIYYDASFRQCQTNSITTNATTPANAHPYDYFSVLFNGATASLNHNGQTECSVHANGNSITNISLSADTNPFVLGSTTNGFVGNLYSAELYAANGVNVAAASDPQTNFNVTSDKFRPQSVGVITSTGLVGWWEPAAANDGLRPWDAPGCSTSQNLWRDLSGNGMNGLLSSNFSACTAGGNGWQGSGAAGTDPYKLTVNGSLTQGVDLGQNLGPNDSITGTSAMSACTWVKSSAYAINQEFFGKTKAGAGGFFLGTDGTTANKVQFSLNNALGSKVTSTATLDANWHYVCGTYNGTNTRIYIDGNYNAKTAYSTAIAATTDDLGIGWGLAQGRATASYMFTGSIGGVQLYNNALSSTQIYNNCMAQAANYTTTAPATFCTLYGTDFP